MIGISILIFFFQRLILIWCVLKGPLGLLFSLILSVSSLPLLCYEEDRKSCIFLVMRTIDKSGLFGLHCTGTASPLQASRCIRLLHAEICGFSRRAGPPPFRLAAAAALHLHLVGKGWVDADVNHSGILACICSAVPILFLQELVSHDEESLPSCIQYTVQEYVCTVLCLFEFN